MFGRPEIAIREQATELETQLADFFADHYDRLVRLAALICHSRSMIEDAVQAAMEQAWRRRTTLREPERIRPWLDQIVVREAIRLNRRPWWSVLQPATDDEAAEIPDHKLAVDATWIALVSAFRRLPVEQRAAVALHLYAGHPVEETAQLMNASVETTRSRLRLARQRLRRELGEEYADD